jgi:hypothetical protein
LIIYFEIEFNRFSSFVDLELAEQYLDQIEGTITETLDSFKIPRPIEEYNNYRGYKRHGYNNERQNNKGRKKRNNKWNQKQGNWIPSWSF